MSLARWRFDHVPAATVRFWAWVDSGVTWMLAFPPAAKRFISGLYAVNGWLGGSAVPPPFEPIHWLFVSLTGSLVSIWVAIRLLHPIGLMAVVDGFGRIWIVGVLVWFIVVLGAPPVLWLFVLTEGVGGVAQLRAALRFSDFRAVQNSDRA
jgi:hypothetical protein